MVATSEPDSKPRGMVRTVPIRPARAMASMLGVWAASKGVLPPSWGRGSSAAPSGMMMAYFMGEDLLVVSRRCRWGRRLVDGVGEVLLGGTCPIEVGRPVKERGGSN